MGVGPVRTGVTAIFPRGKSCRGSCLRGMVHGERQWRDDRHHMGRGIRISLRPRDDHKHAQRRCRARRCDRLAAETRNPDSSRRLVVAPSGRRNVGWRLERHQWFSRKAGRRGRRDAGRPLGTDRRRQRGRWHWHDLLRIQGWHRHFVAQAFRKAGWLHRWRAGPMQFWRPPFPAHRGSRWATKLPADPMCADTGSIIVVVATDAPLLPIR